MSLRWKPRVRLSKAEERVVGRMKRTGRLFAFLRKCRHLLFSDDFQAELEVLYPGSPRGAPKPPAFLAMVTLLQAYEQKGDAAAVEAAVFDGRWRMVLALPNDGEPGFSQGALVDFRRRLIEHDLDRRLVERTVELARETGGFGYKQLQVALDSAPLWGAGRVEDTFNLVAHAARLVITCASKALGLTDGTVRERARLTLFGSNSVKAELDIDWADKQEQAHALARLLSEIGRLRAWLDVALPADGRTKPLVAALQTLEQVISQDIEPDPGGGHRIKRGTSTQRRISIRDGDMRHGRKSKSRVINGFKRHVAVDMKSGLILATSVRPANEREHVAMDEEICKVLDASGEIEELHIDRGYLPGKWAKELHEKGKRVVSKHWITSCGGRFSKNDFDIDLERGEVRCPGGKTAPIRKDNKAQFSRGDCGPCELRQQCTKAAYRSVQLHEQEELLQRFKVELRTPEGRAERRKRVIVEHVLAHVTRRQGPRARYIGLRKNLFDIRRVAAIENLNRIEHRQAA